jgi:tetratricopeptide (TPR) repeat protein
MKSAAALWLGPWLLAAVAAAEETGVAPLAEATRHFEAGRFRDAAEAAARVPKEDAASWAKARYLLGEAELVLGDAVAAEAAFREGAEAKPASEPILTGLGRALLVQGKPADALPVLEKATAANAKSARAKAFLGLAKSRAGNADDGKKDVAAAVKLDPADPEVARVAVEERLGADDAPGAAKVAAAFSKARKDHPAGPFLQGLADEKAKKYDEAIASYEKAIALDAAYLDAHKNLAILCIAQNPLYQDQGRTKKAMEHFAKYVELGGKDETIQRTYDQLKSFLESRK